MIFMSLIVRFREGSERAETRRQSAKAVNRRNAFSHNNTSREKAFESKKKKNNFERILRVEEATTVSISLCFVVNKYTVYGYM
jgi:hypothetical protein